MADRPLSSSSPTEGHRLAWFDKNRIERAIDQTCLRGTAVHITVEAHGQKIAVLIRPERNHHAILQERSAAATH